MKLQALIDQYVAFRASPGEKRRASPYLMAFGRFIGAGAELADVRPEQVKRFLTGAGPITRTWQVKLSTLRPFYQYAISRGYVSNAPLPTAIPKLPPAFEAHVYSWEELRRLFQAAKRFHRPTCAEPGILYFILLTLYGTGLRLQELLDLDRADVDMQGCLLTVRHGKFGKARLVPFGRQLQKPLLKYNAHCRSSAGDTPFFTTRAGERLKANTLQHNYRILCERAGVRRTDGGRFHPRLHDLRHTFAVHRLTSWYRKGADVQTLLPLLAVYLGHVHIRSTQVYLSMTPELLEQASSRFEHYTTMKSRHE
jgi:integrase